MVTNDQMPEQNESTYGLVHGAWHGSWCWKGIRKNLQDVLERILMLVYLDAFVPEDRECVFDLHSPERAQQMRLQAQAAGDGWKVPPIPAEPFNVNLRDAA